MGLFDKLFGKQKLVTEQTSATKKIPTLEEFPQLNEKERMGLIMDMGDSGRLEFFPFLKYAIQKDKDIHVKFAALKRIHLFKEHPDTTQLLTELKKSGEGENFEPYFSMALLKLGIITLKEFEDKINNSK